MDRFESTWPRWVTLWIAMLCATMIALQFFGCTPPTDPAPVAQNWVAVPYVVWADTLDIEYRGVEDSTVQRIVREMDRASDARDTFPDGLTHKQGAVPVNSRDRFPESMI